MENILETLQDRLDATAFIKGLKESNLLEMLDERGPFTVLAPINQAFENLSENKEELFLDQELLKDIMSQHIVIGNYTAQSLKEMDEVVTLGNFNLAIELHNEGLIVGSSKIIEADIKCSNGYIHIVDTV